MSGSSGVIGARRSSPATDVIGTAGDRPPARPTNRNGSPHAAHRIRVSAAYPVTGPSSLSDGRIDVDRGGELGVVELADRLAVWQRVAATPQDIVGDLRFGPNL